MAKETAESLELLARLVSFDTTSHKSNLALIDFVDGYLTDLGAQTQRVYNDDHDKANLIAKLGRSDAPGVVLSGHTDVVPVTGQNWTSDPFELAGRGSRLYGRGSCDMKGFIAEILACAPRIVGNDPAVPLFLVLSYDEEVGCLGAPRAIKQLVADYPTPRLCIVGEPTGMVLGIGQKGKQAFRVTVIGLAAHSSLAPHGINAVNYAAELVVALRKLARRFAEQGPFDAGFDVAHTTVHTGYIRGGTALNIVPAECHFDFEIRYLPGDDPQSVVHEVKSFAEQQLLPEMRAIAPDCDIDMQVLESYPGIDIRDDAVAARVAAELLDGGEHTKLSFGSEAGLFHDLGGMPAMVCGPGHIRQAHKADEYVDIEQLEACRRFLHKLTDAMRDPAFCTGG